MHQHNGRLGATAIESQTAQELRASAAQATANGNYAWAQQLNAWASRLENDPASAYAAPYVSPYEPYQYPYIYQNYPLSYYSAFFHPISSFIPLSPLRATNFTITTTTTPRTGLFAR